MLYSFIIVFILIMVLASAVLFFLRDPERKAPAGDLILCPADGTVVEIKEKDEWLVIATFMQLTNMHVQWVPYTGKVVSIERREGPSHPAFLPEAANNCQVITTLETKIGKMIVKQVVGKVVRRIETFVKAGESIAPGQRLGRIIMGSRVELWLPKGKVRIAVSVKQKVKASESIAAKIGEKNGADQI